MKVGDLNMHCGECHIIDFCNDYEDTPPCAQMRFKNITVNEYLKAAVNTDMTYAKTKDEMVDKIYEALESEEE